MSKKHKKHKKKRDPVATFVGIWNAITWLALFTSMMYISAAKPETQTIFENKYGKTARTVWLMDYVDIAFRILVVVIGFSIAGMLINAGLISGQKKKHISYGLLFACIISIFSVIIIYFEFMR